MNLAAGEPFVRDVTRLHSRLNAQIRMLVDIFLRWPEPSDTPLRWITLGDLRRATVHLSFDALDLCDAVDAAREALNLASVKDLTRRVALQDMYDVQAALRIKAEAMRRAVLGER